MSSIIVFSIGVDARRQRSLHFAEGEVDASSRDESNLLH